MNNRHIESLTHRLLQALDSNYDVINMDAVLSVIAALESTTITKEQLEMTRLAKYINLFRRRTKSEQLAKRAKSLLKKWREMVGIQQPAAGPNTSGYTEFQSTKPTSPLTTSSGPAGNVPNSIEKQNKWNAREESSEPTSFVNLIPNFSSSFANHNNANVSPLLNGPSVRNVRKNRNTKIDSINAEQFTNSNSMNVSNITPTIVIDIEDSNSGSNVIDKQDDVVIISESTRSNPGIKSSKHKKSKKEKKKPRNAPDMLTTTVVIDAESSESQQAVDQIATTMGSISERPHEKPKSAGLNVTNMSEILSISNSSMSSIFPTSLAHTRTDSELSFAGKFGGTGAKSTAKISTCDNSTTNAIAQSSLSGDIYVYNENSNITGSGTIPKTTSKNRIFAGSGYNSNDSISNSRHSNFEVVDTIGPGVSNPVANAVVNIAKETTAPISLEKMPKKRGRKKGSKGVDSVIAKDTSLSSQMLMQSLSGGNKKVKTTKELYAEMQNRKLGVSTPTTPSHWASGSSQPPLQAQQARRDSFCSEPSLHSPRTFDACSTNATISTIATNSTTPDKNAAALRKGFETGVVDIDSTSDSMNSGGGISRSSVVQESTIKALAAVEQQLVDVALMLPPVPSVSEIEKDCASEVVPCTCKIIEILPDPPNGKAEQDSAPMGEMLSLDKLKNSDLTSSEDSEMPVLTISVGGKNERSHDNGVAAVEPKQPPKPKKSIFDLDFDDDEDPLHSLIAEVAAANANTASIETTAKTDNSDNHETRIETAHQKNQTSSELFHDQTAVLISNDFSDPAAIPIVSATHVLPSYKVEEDIFCPAKDRFEVQTQQITEFHINLLHNFFIPNVNGNWNDAVAVGAEAEQDAFQVLDGVNVVPKISGEDHIRKDLREFRFQRKLKRKITAAAPKYEIPFLGVARCFTKRHRKPRAPLRKSSTDICNQTELNNEDVPVAQIEEERNIGKETAMQIKNECREDADSFVQQPDEMKSSWNMPINNQKPILAAITVNVDSDAIDEDQTNAVSSTIDSQNLLAIASNVLSYTSADNAESKIIDNSVERANKDAPLETVIASDEYDFPNISGDILNNNNNNNSCSIKYDSDSSSHESNSSLKQTQNSINQKLRKHRRRQRRQQELEQNSQISSPKRKRRRKKQQAAPSIKIKCLKIAINGGITTQRHVKIASSNSGGSTTDKDSENEAGEADNEDRASNIGDDNNSSNNEEYGANLDEPDEDADRAIETINDENDMNVVCGGEEDDMEDENGEYLDEDDGDDYVGEFHEVVTRDLSPSTSLGNNHIVLTIKKTPSKANSPASNSPNVSLQSSALLLATASTATKAKKADDANKSELEKNENVALVSTSCEPKTQIDKIRHTPPNSNLIAAAYAALIKQQNERCRLRRRRRKRKNTEPFLYRFPDEVRDEGGDRIFKKRHQKLFFPDEIYTKLDADSNTRHPILNISSCSSSCNEMTEFEYESNSSDDEKKQATTNLSDIKKERRKPESIDSSSSSDSDCTDSEDSDAKELSTTKDITSENTKDTKNNIDQDELPEHNNGLLVSFNEICAPKSEEATKVFPEILNKNSFAGALSTQTPLSYLNPRTEFQTGLLEIDAQNQQEDSSTKRLQQFKEWHQVLQLKSYNDEPLTVLPYVVLD